MLWNMWILMTRKARSWEQCSWEQRSWNRAREGMGWTALRGGEAAGKRRLGASPRCTEVAVIILSDNAQRELHTPSQVQVDVH